MKPDARLTELERNALTETWIRIAMSPGDYHDDDVAEARRRLAQPDEHQVGEMLAAQETWKLEIIRAVLASDDADRDVLATRERLKRALAPWQNP